VQWPNLDNGYDVWNDGPWVLADDFVCSNPGPITDIHLWGSWLNDQVQTNSLTFWLAIYSNVPVSATNSFSYPGNLLWQEQFGPGQYIESFWSFGQESFLDPGASAVVGPDSQVWYYLFLSHQYLRPARRCRRPDDILADGVCAAADRRRIPIWLEEHTAGSK